MSDARNDILARVAAANGRQLDAEPPAQILTRMRESRIGPQLHWPDADLDRFLTQAQAASATVDRVAGLQQAAAAVREYQARHQLAAPAVLAPHPLLDGLALADAQRRAVRPSDPLAVTVAFAAVAETGSLALLSGIDTPTALNFLPEHLLCMVPAKRVIASLEDLWSLIRRERGSLPRTVNLITGPSRTADVEQTIQLGAHGPRRLHLLLLED